MERKTFVYKGKTYDWLFEHPENYTWEDGKQALTPLQSQIEIVKFLEENN